MSSGILAKSGKHASKNNFTGTVQTRACTSSYSALSHPPRERPPKCGKKSQARYNGFLLAAVWQAAALSEALLAADVYCSFSTGVASCPSGRFRFRLTISTSSQCLWNVIPAQQGRRTMLEIKRIINCSSLAGPMKHIWTHLYRLHLGKDISVHGKLSSLRAVDDRKGAVWCLALSCYTEGTWNEARCSSKPRSTGATLSTHLEVHHILSLVYWHLHHSSSARLSMSKYRFTAS